MSEICIVCNEEIHLAYRDEVEGIPIHSECFIKFNEDKEFYKQEYIEKFKEMNDQFAPETKIPEAKSETKIPEAKSETKIPKDGFSILTFLAESFSKIVSFAAVFTAISGFSLGVSFIFSSGGSVIGGFLLIVATPFIVILVYGFLAMNIEIYKHLKSIDNKLD